MQITKIDNYKFNQNPKYNNKNTYVNKVNFSNRTSIYKPQKGIKKSGLKNFMLMFAAFLSMFAACNKEDLSKPKPTGYVAEEVMPKNNFPTDDPEILAEYTKWCEENWPEYLWPDYMGPYPDGVTPDNVHQLYEDWINNDVVNWWKEHGFPDWDPWTWNPNP